MISFYDGGSWTLTTRIFDSEKSNENEIITTILWNHWVLYDTIRIFFQPNVLKQK